MAVATLSQCCSSTTSAARSVRRAGQSAKARGRTSLAAVATEVSPARVFTDEEWAHASKEAVKLAAAYAQAAAAAVPEQGTAAAPPPGRVFTDDEWQTAFQLAASQNPLLYNSVSATADSSAPAELSSSSTPVFPPPPPGRVFSDEEWEYAFGLAAKGLEAVTPASPSGFPVPPPGRVFSDEEWQDAFGRSASGKLEDVEEPVPQPFAAVMAFGGPAPETVNGRLAMFGFITALASELGSAKSVLTQYSEASGGVLAAVLLLTAASLIPLLKGVKPKGLGPFTLQAEKLNGRAAMVGFAATLLVESIKGSPLF